jgi:hypothetical protein
MAHGLAMDTGGSLYVADDANHRVLRFSPPFSTNMAASLVIGQADFISGSANRGGTAGQDTLNRPKGVAMDASGNLYVAEYENNRVTRYSQPFSNGMLASDVFGQPDFTTIGENTGGIGPSSLYHPVDVAVSRTGDALFITDQGNVRVLGYEDPLNDTSADEHYGQPDFISSVPNNGGISAASINFDPLGLALDAYGNCTTPTTATTTSAYDLMWWHTPKATSRPGCGVGKRREYSLQLRNCAGLPDRLEYITAD